MSQPRPLLSPPETEAQLLAQAQQLSGYTLGELAALAGLVITLMMVIDLIGSLFDSVKQIFQLY